MGEATDSERAMLDEWKRERDELTDLITGLENRIAKRGGGVPGASVGSTGKIGPDEFFRMSTPEAIKKLLKIVGKPARTTQEIIDFLKAGGMDTSYTNVYTALLRLTKRGVAKVGDNWGLDDWYPPAPAGRESKAANGKDEEVEEVIPGGGAVVQNEQVESED